MITAMSTLQVLPVIAYLGCVIAIMIIALGSKVPARLGWLIPAALGAVFLLFSILTVVQEGVLQFWVNHTTNLAGNQVWFDLIIAVTIGFYLLAPVRGPSGCG
jgi:sorbitol-specific phosphotransferase system component IIBC